MIELSDPQIGMIRENVDALAKQKRYAFLMRVEAVLQGRRSISDDDVSTAVRLALRDLIHNSAEWKEWRRNSPASHEDKRQRGAVSISHLGNRSHDSGQQKHLKANAVVGRQSVAQSLGFGWRLLSASFSNSWLQRSPPRPPTRIDRSWR
jgi:hypothetical protein